MVKSQQLFDRLKQKKAYEKFMKNNPSAFLYAVFCILSKNEKDGDKIQFDFFLPENNKIGHSEYPFDEIKVQSAGISLNPDRLNLNQVKIDIEELWDIVDHAMDIRGDRLSISKIMGVLRNEFWDLTCTTNTLDMIRVKINNINGECIEYKKDNLTNFIQIKKKNNTNQ